MSLFVFVETLVFAFAVGMFGVRLHLRTKRLENAQQGMYARFDEDHRRVDMQEMMHDSLQAAMDHQDAIIMAELDRRVPPPPAPPAIPVTPPKVVRKDRAGNGT